MKTLKSQLNEAATDQTYTILQYTLNVDIYNALSDIAYRYSMKNKKFEEKDVSRALNWFMNKFFEENK